MALGFHNQYLSFLTLASKYLNTSINVFEEMITNGNPHMLIGMKDMEEYDKLTKWSDFNILIPTLFTFYHGIELTLKGLLLLENEVQKDSLTSHNLEHLFTFVKEKYSKETVLLELLKKYIYENNSNMPILIKKLIQENTDIKNTADLFIALRYPTGKQMEQIYNYNETKYQEEEGVTFAQEIKSDAYEILLQMVKIYRGKQ